MIFNDTLDGGDGRDGLYGEEGDDYLQGGTDNDNPDYWNGNWQVGGLYGGAGNDTLDGGDGDDYLDPGEGIDISEGEMVEKINSMEEMVMIPS